MNINSADIRSGIVFNENTSVTRKITADILNSPKPANVDKMVLSPPVSEVTYKRTELLKGSATAQTACVTQQSVRMMTFANGSTLTCMGNTSYFAINLDKFPRNFGSSGTDMRDIDSAVEETWVHKEYAYETSSVSVSSLLEGGGTFVNSRYDLTAVNAAAVSFTHTTGTVNCKNDDILGYIRNVLETESIRTVSASLSQSVYSAKKSDSPYFGGFNGIADLEARAKKIDEDIARAKAEYGDDLPSGDYGSFFVPEKGETKVSAELVSQSGNTYNYKVNRENAAAEATSEKSPETKDGAKGLTDRDIFVIFTGREPTKSQGTSLKGLNMAGTEDWFDEDGNFIYKDDEDFISHYRKFYELTIFSGIPFDKHCTKNVADFFGNVGKRIDEAYAAGKCTKEQKEQLDKMLADNAVYFSERVQRKQALLKICREEFNMPVKERAALIESRKNKTSEENTAERKARIEEYVNRFFKVEPEKLFEMINAVRYGMLSLLPKA